MNLDKNAIKTALSVSALLGHYGIDAPIEGRTICPFCGVAGDKDTAQISAEHFYCHRCNASLDIYDIVQEWNACDFKEAVTFCAELAGLGNSTTPEQRTELEERKAQATAKREAVAKERNRLHAEAATIARDLWKSALPATEKHGYLQKKQVPSLGLRLDKSCLLIPVYGTDGSLWTLQRIDETGFKSFLPSGKTKGGFYAIPAKDKRTDGTLYICEGYSTGASVHMTTEATVLVAFNATNLLPVAMTARAKYPQREIVIAADNDIYPAYDRKKNVGVINAELAAQDAKALIAIPTLASGKKCDFNDLHVADGLKAVKSQLEAAAPPPPKVSQAVKVKLDPKPLPVLRVVGLSELLSLEIPPRNYLLYPIIQEQGLIMLFADRGTGKTFVALWIAYAVATGGKVFSWYSEQAWPVLYIDGEMPFSAMQGRIASIVTSTDIEPQEGFFNVLTPDLQGNDTLMPNLATQDGQAAIEPYLQGIKLVVIDNLATLCRHGRSNDEESWQPVQEWVLSLRRRGISVLIVHHASKNGSQRGTSAKEDILDTSIQLRRPKDYNPEQGARFEVHLTKARGIFGVDAEPFEAQLTSINGHTTWTVKSIEDAQLEQIRTLAADDATQREIAEELGISPAKVNRLCKKHNIATKGGRK